MVHNTLEPAGVRAVWRRDDAGCVEVPAIAEHRVAVHASPATPSMCSAQGLRYVRVFGDVDLTPAHQIGCYEADLPTETLEIRVPPGLLARVAEDLGRPRAAVGLEARHLVRDDRLAHLAWALDAEARAAVPVGPLLVDAIGVAIATHLLGLHADAVAAPVGLSPRQLQRVVDYIEAHLDAALTVDLLADIAGVSSAHLRHWFKRMTGSAVHRYIVRRRVERARVLLLQRRLPASQIALATGFSHQSHMARWMRRELGVTPRALVRTG